LQEFCWARSTCLNNHTTTNIAVVTRYWLDRPNLYQIFIERPLVLEYGLKVNPNPALETAGAKLLASLDRKVALDPGYRWRLLGVVNLFNFSFTELGERIS
jgi:hypothetical protein